MFGSTYLLPLFMQMGIGLSASYAGNLLLPAGGIAIALFVGWAWGERAFAAQLSNHGQLGNQGLARVVSLLLRWVTPVLILLVMLAGLGVFSGA